jgi:O-antigen/teichoic acid export membrane protein
MGRLTLRSQLTPSYINLKPGVISSAAFNITARTSSLAIQMITMLILARILDPGDFGLIGMVTPFLAVFMIFGNLGLTNAVLQQPALTAQQLSSLFYMNVAVSLVLASTLFLLAPRIAALYKTPEILPITVLVSAIIIVSGVGSLQTTLLQRNLRFKSILIAEVVSQGGASAIAVVLALRGFGFMALAWQAVTQPTIHTMMIWLQSGWVPGWPEWGAEVRRMFMFGGYSAMFNLLNTLGRRMDNVLIGWRFGHVELGPYAIAYRLFLTPISMITGPLGQVMIPSLARVRSEPDRFSRWYLRVLRLITLTVLPPCVAFAIFADDLVEVVLGPQWEAAAPIVRLLLPIGALQASYTTIGWLMLALGRADRQLGWALIAIPLFLIAFLAGLPWGAKGVATGYAGANLILFIPGFWYGIRGTQIRLAQIFQALVPGVLAAGAVAVILAAASGLSAPLAAPFRLGCASLITLITIGIGSVLIFGWKSPKTEIIGALKFVWPRG